MPPKTNSNGSKYYCSHIIPTVGTDGTATAKLKLAGKIGINLFVKVPIIVWIFFSENSPFASPNKLNINHA